METAPFVIANRFTAGAAISYFMSPAAGGRGWNQNEGLVFRPAKAQQKQRATLYLYPPPSLK
jgi:hypothetical protein